MSGPWERYAGARDTVPNGPWSKFAQTTQPSPEQQKEATTWGDVPSTAVQNIPSSALNFAKGIVQPILHPIDTTKAIFNTGYGLASKAAGALGMEQDPQEKAADEATADAIGGHFKGRYGSMEGLKKTLSTDPVGALGDASIILTGGGAAAARGPGIVGQAGQAIRATGAAIDPLNATLSAGRAVAGHLPASVLGATTGVGMAPIQEAFQAGRTGNPAFVEHMRGQRPIDEAVGMAEAGVTAMTRDRGATYRADMAATRADVAPLDFGPIRNALNHAADGVMYRGIVTDPIAARTVTQMGEVYQQFAGLPVAERTAEAFDALKKSIGAVRETTQPGTNARRVADQVYSTVRTQITTQSPSYAEAMRNYAEASDRIGEIRRTLSVNERATTDTTLRKLQSVMRNNVNTNYGARTHLMEELNAYQPDLRPALAGQAMNSLAPRGMANAVVGANALYSMATANPMAMAALPFASPRIVGEGVHALGQGVGALDAAVGLGGPLVPQLARYGYQAGNATRPVYNALFSAEPQP
jgi:hypothetical protein